MKSKRFKKYVNLARKTYALEAIVNFGHIVGRPATKHDVEKHKKLRHRWGKFSSNPEYKRRLFKTYLYV